MALPAGTRERQLKRWSAHKKLALIAGDLKSLHSLAKRMRGHRPANLVKPAVWDAHWGWVPGTVIRHTSASLSDHL